MTASLFIESLSRKKFASEVTGTYSTKTLMDAKLAELKRTIEDAVRGMATDDLLRHPEDKWSVLQVLDHLNLTYVGTIKNFEKCLATGRPISGSERRSKRWRRICIINMGYFPPGRKSPQGVCPRDLPPQTVAQEVLQNIERMDSVIAESETRFNRRELLATHPILGPLTGPEWRKFHLVHGKHHVKQILRLRNGR
jgi:hypothetical protein